MSDCDRASAALVEIEVLNEGSCAPLPGGSGQASEQARLPTRGYQGGYQGGLHGGFARSPEGGATKSEQFSNSVIQPSEQPDLVTIPIRCTQYTYYWLLDTSSGRLTLRTVKHGDGRGTLLFLDFAAARHGPPS
eukprot:9472564-Pyramimonas_sp.AAC.1